MCLGEPRARRVPVYARAPAQPRSPPVPGWHSDLRGLSCCRRPASLAGARLSQQQNHQHLIEHRTFESTLLSSAALPLLPVPEA